MTPNLRTQAQSKDVASQLHITHHLTESAAEMLGPDHQAAAKAVEVAVVIDGAVDELAAADLTHCLSATCRLTHLLGLEHGTEKEWH